MKAGKSWSLRDVDEQTRSALLKAAEKSGLSVSEWLGGKTDEAKAPASPTTRQKSKASAARGPRPGSFAAAASALASEAATNTQDHDPSLQVRDAIGQLTSRLSKMDETARAAVDDLPAKLVEVESRLAFLVEARQSPDERARALTDTSAMIEGLVREIDSSVGVASGPTAAPSPAARLAAAVAKHRESAGPINAAAEQLADIRFQLDALLNEDADQQHEPPPRAALSSGSALRNPETRADEAVPQTVTQRSVQAPAAQSGAADQMRRLELQLGEIMARLPGKKDAELAIAVREIANRQRVIDERAETAAMRRDQKALSEAVATLREEIATRLAEVARAVSETASTAPRQSIADVSRLEQRFDGLAKTVAMALSRAPLDSGAQEEARNLGDRLDEISANLRRVMEKAEFQAAVQSESPTVAGLESRLGNMAANINSLLAQGPTGGTAPVIAKLEAKLDSIAESVDGLFMGMGPGDTSAILKQIDERLEKLAGDSVAAGLGRLEARLDRMASELEVLGAPRPGSTDEAGLNGRLDEIAQALAALAQRTSSTADVDGLHDRLNAVAERMDKVDPRDSALQTDVATIRAEVGTIRTLHQRLQALTERIDAIAAVVQHQPIVPVAELKDGIAAIRGMHERLQAISERIDHLAEERDALPPAEMKAGFAVIRSVEEQVQALRAQIGATPAPAVPPAAMNEMRAGVAAISALHDEIRSLAGRIEDMAAQRTPTGVLEDIKKGIGAIRSEIAERQPTSTAPLEKLILDLAKQVAKVTRAPGDSKGIAELASRVTALAGELEEAKPRVRRLDDIEARMARLQESLADTRNESIESAKAEARAVVQDLSGMVATGEVDASVIAALVQDLEGLKTSAGDSDRRTRSKLDAVNAALAQVVSRLSALEVEPSRQVASAFAPPERQEARAAEPQAAKPTAATPTPQKTVAAKAATAEAAPAKATVAKATTAEAASSKVAVAKSATPEPAAAAKAPAVKTTAQEAPAAKAPVAKAPPPAAQPQQAAVHQVAAAEPVASSPQPAPAAPESTPGEKDSRGQRADFIAAARRAAQAAAAEAAKASRAAAEAKRDNPGRLTRFRQAILGRKKTLLLAAAAVVLAVGALQIFADRLNGTGDAWRLADATAIPPIATGTPPDAPRPVPPTTIAELATESDTTTVASAGTANLAPGALFVPATVDRTLTFSQPVYKAPAVVQPSEVSPPPPAQAAPAPVVATPAPQAPVRVVGPPYLPQASFPGPAATPPAPSATPAAAPVVLAATAPAEGNGSSAPLVDRGIGTLKLTSAALDGNPAAAFEVGSRYAAGDRVPRDMEKASEWYRRAADGGLAVAQFRLGSLYERGEGVGQDLSQAMAWYQRAADQGNINAMHNLAVLLSQSDNGAADGKLALKWFTAAANYGLRDSQYNLGVIYARGLGTMPNLPEAYKWFAIAARSGDVDAGGRRDELAASLSAGEIAQATNAASSWRSKQANVDANAVNSPPGGWDADTITDSDRQALVRTIQTLLADQGYDPGPADGRPGPKTVRAVKDFQRTAGVAQTGQIDMGLLAVLAGGGR